MPHLSSFSTRGVPRDEVVDYWRQARREAYVSVRTDPVDSRFEGEIRLGQYEDFRLSTKWASAEETRRSASDIAQGREDQERMYLLFQLSGSLLVEQMGREALALPGSLVVYNSAVPFRLRSREDYRQVVLELPVDETFALAGASRSDDLFARRFDCGGALGAVEAFFVSLARTQRSDPLVAQHLEPQASALGTSLISLISPSSTPADASDLLRRNEAVAYMSAHLVDPRLDAEGIAAGLHLSRRTLFRLFEGTGESVMGRLRSLRLERARRMLRTQPGKPISAIAAETGFSGPVQFYRAFRAVMEMTPGEYRRAAICDVPEPPTAAGQRP